MKTLRNNTKKEQRTQYELWTARVTRNIVPTYLPNMRILRTKHYVCAIILHNIIYLFIIAVLKNVWQLLQKKIRNVTQLQH